MAGFTESMLFKKLEDLNESPQSIQTLSLWLIHHRKHYQVIVNNWSKVLLKANEMRKLTLMYLANDVIQNSRRKGPEFSREFTSVLKKAFQFIGTSRCSERTVRKLNRMLEVWRERSVYDSHSINEYIRLLHNTKRDNSISAVEVPEKKLKVSRISQIEVEVAGGGKEVHTTLSPYSPPRDPPEPEELIKALMDLESAASVDVAVREKISELPPEISEVKLLAKLESKEAAEELATRVNAAVTLLQDYNDRLAREMEERKKVTQMLKDFTLSQKELMNQAQTRIEEYREKLTKVEMVRNEVFSHMSNLPNLRQLPDVTGGLAPLPSAGDLFT